jgi:uncharacterized sodium:solute symporter family permease YidK
MNDTQRLKYLRVALIIVGATSLGLYPLMMLLPSGWSWNSGYSDYPLMIVGIYATLGVFLLMATRNPLDHLSLIRARRDHVLAAAADSDCGGCSIGIFSRSTR